MNAPNPEIHPILGTAMGGGYYAGRIRIDGQLYALIVAPKAEGEHKPAQWIAGSKDVPGALSYHDGRANTQAMAEAGSKLAKWAQDLRIDGHGDWYLPAQDELEVIYRNLKPTAEDNWCYARSGINLNAAEPTTPYMPKIPAQTLADAFRKDGEQAFEESWYWTSTRHIANTDYAWSQDFDDGHQGYDDTSLKVRARAVRRSPI